MQNMLFGRATVIWLLLSGATLISWGVGHDAIPVPARYAGAVIILVAFIKVRFVFLEFMETRHAPLPLRIGAELWGIVMCLTLIMLYLSGSSPQG